MTNLPSIMADYLDYLRKTLAKKIGDKFKEDKKYKFFIKDQTYWYFLMGMNKFKLNLEYKKRLYSDQ